MVSIRWEGDAMQKREPRIQTSIGARVRMGNDWRGVTIMNVSRHGLMLHVTQPPQRGSYIELRRSSIVIVGRIAWSNGRRCGIRAQDVIDIAALTDQPQHESAWKPGDPCRRQQQRDAIDNHAARSEFFARNFQFAAVIAFLLVASVMILKLVGDSFAEAMRHVTAAL